MILDAGGEGLARAASWLRLSSSGAASDMVRLKVRPRLVSEPNAGGWCRGARRRFVSTQGPDSRR
jgi:hypothetical protein